MPVKAYWENELLQDDALLEPPTQHPALSAELNTGPIALATV